MSARLTRPEALDRATQLTGCLRRLESLHHGEVNASKGYTIGAQQARQNRAGRKQELDQALQLAAELVAGLAGIGPARDGQLGGQRQGGHDTSAAALELVAPRAGTQRDQVLAAISAAVRGDMGGYTDVEVAEHTLLAPNSVRPRRVELVDAGWLEDSGRRRKHNGREHVVWTLTEAARHTGDTTTTDRSPTP